MKKLFLGLLAGVLSLGITMAADLVETAAKQGSLNTWAKTLKAAGLEKMLQGKGPYTIFAPSDQAFARINSVSMSMLMNPENKQALAALLAYHIVPGNIMIRDLKTMPYPTQISAYIQIKKEKEAVTVNNVANVSKTDIVAANGIIHIIDAPLFPPGVNTSTKTEKTVNGQTTEQKIDIIDMKVNIKAPDTSVTR